MKNIFFVFQCLILASFGVSNASDIKVQPSEKLTLRKIWLVLF